MHKQFYATTGHPSLCKRASNKSHCKLLGKKYDWGFTIVIQTVYNDSCFNNILLFNILDVLHFSTVLPWEKRDNSHQPLDGSDIQTQSVKVAWLAKMWAKWVIKSFFWLKQ